MKVDYNTRVTALERSCAFVDKYDEGQVWLSVHTRFGSSHCIIEADEAQKMINALQEIINSKE